MSGCHTWSAVDIFNTLCVFIKESVRKQEIKLECMNQDQFIYLLTKYVDHSYNWPFMLKTGSHLLMTIIEQFVPQ